MVNTMKKIQEKKITKKIPANFSARTPFHPDEESVVLLIKVTEPVRDPRVEF